MKNSFDSKEVSVIDNTTYITLTIGSVTLDIKSGSSPDVDPILENNSWATIRAVCEAGDATNYWSVGDTKTDTGTDGYTRTFRIVDMQGLYNKHVIFEQVELEGDTGVGANGVKFDSNGSGLYENASINTTVLPATILRYSSDLQENLTNTTVVVAVGMNTNANVTNKLFLEAVKEVWTSSYGGGYAANEDFLTTYTYWTNHTTNSDHIKKVGNTGQSWWLRTKMNSNTTAACIIQYDGAPYRYSATYTEWYAPCFSF